MQALPPQAVDPASLAPPWCCQYDSPSACRRGPAGTANVIWLVGASGLGKPINEAVHRPELFCERCGCELTDIATPERVAQVLNAELRMLNLNNARVMLNQVDTLSDPTMADRFEAALDRPVVASSLK